VFSLGLRVGGHGLQHPERIGEALVPVVVIEVITDLTRIKHVIEVRFRERRLHDFLILQALDDKWIPLLIVRVDSNVIVE